MASNPATAADVAARYRDLTAEETTRVTTLLGDAWRIIITELPSVPTRLDASTLDPDLVVQVEAAMVIRRIQNPDGLLEEAIDDYRLRRDQATSSGTLYLTGDELTLLSEASTASDGAWTIDPYGTEPEWLPSPTLTPWLEDC